MGLWWKSSRIQICAEIILAGVGVVIGDLLGYILIGIGALGMAYTLYSEGLLSSFSRGGRMPIPKAAQLMYNKASQVSRDVAIRRGSNIEEYNTPTGHMRQLLMIYAEDKSISLWGRREPGLEFEEIELNLNSVLHCTEDGTLTRGSETNPEWVDVRVARKDVLKALKLWEEENRGRST